MKYPVFIALILLSFSSLAQVNIHKVWIGEHHEYLDLGKNDTAKYDAPGPLTMIAYRYTGDTIRFPIAYRTGGITMAHTDSNAYNIVSLTNNTLELQVIHNEGRPHETIFANKKQMVFRDSASVFKKNNAPFRFQKLYYEMKEWYSGIITKLQVDSTGKVYYSQGNHPPGDSSNLEYPKLGQLTPVQLKALVQLLKTSELDSFPAQFGTGNSIDMVFFGFYYNNKVVTGRGATRNIPYVHRSLVEYIKSIIKTTAFKQLYEPVRLAP